MLVPDAEEEEEVEVDLLDDVVAGLELLLLLGPCGAERQTFVPVLRLLQLGLLMPGLLL